MAIKNYLKKAIVGTALSLTCFISGCDEVPLELTQPDLVTQLAEQKVDRTWLQDIIDGNEDNFYDGMNCDNNQSWRDGTGSGDAYHHPHRISRYHQHTYFSSSHMHRHNRKIENQDRLLDKPANDMHEHLIFIYHAHEHVKLEELFNYDPPKKFHTHSCE